MLNLRVSVTAIDSWLFCMRHEASSVDDLMVQLRGESVQTEPMRVGSAFHKAMEMARPGEHLSLEANGYSFTVMPEVEIALPAYRELKLETEIVIDSNLTVTLVGKVDGFEPPKVTDHKTTKRFEAEYMLETFQWKQYLAMTGADIFQWNVFVIDEGRLTEFAGKSVWEYRVKDYHELRQFRYPDMEAECLDTLRKFLSFLNVKTLRWPSQDCALAKLLKANSPPLAQTLE